MNRHLAQLIRVSYVYPCSPMFYTLPKCLYNVIAILASKYLWHFLFYKFLGVRLHSCIDYVGPQMRRRCVLKWL